MEILRLIDLQQVAVQIICFLVLFFTLRAFIWKRFLALLDERKERIAAEFKHIENQKNEMLVFKADYEQKIANIDQVVREKMLHAIEEGKREGEEIRKKAHHDAQDIIENARKNVQYEVSKATTEVREQIVDLAIEAAARVLEEKMTEVQDRKLINNFLNELEKI